MQQRYLRFIFTFLTCLLALHAPLPASAGDSDLRILEAMARYSDLKIVDYSWSRSRFSVATWKVKIKNLSKTTAYRDLHFSTRYSGESGTTVDRSWIGHTAYIRLKPGQSRTITFTQFAHSESRSALVWIDKAVAE